MTTLNDAEKKILKEGGISWKCEECKKSGVLLATSKIAINLRETFNVPAPESLNIYLPNCERHTEKPE